MTSTCDGGRQAVSCACVVHGTCLQQAPPSRRREHESRKSSVAAAGAGRVAVGRRAAAAEARGRRRSSLGAAQTGPARVTAASPARARGAGRPKFWRRGRFDLQKRPTAPARRRGEAGVQAAALVAAARAE